MPATFTCAAASWDTRGRAARNGTYGSTRQGAYWLLPGSTNRYVWWSHDDGTGRFVGYDPGDYEAALAGYVGIEVQLAAGNRTAAQVATATRAALNSTYTVSGASANVIIAGGGLSPLLADVGEAFVSRGTAGLWGSRGMTPASHGNAMNDVVCSHATSPAEDVVITAIGVHVSGGDMNTPPDPDEPIEVALYVGGAAGEAGGAAFAGTTLVAQGSLAPDAVGYVWLPLTAAQAAEIPASSSLWLCAKGGLGYTTTRTNYHGQGSASSDLTNQQLVVLEAGGGAGQIDPTYGVPFPASLAGINVASVFGVTLMANLEYRTAPFASDGSWGAVLGVHTDDVLGGSQSDLLGGDPLGANVLMSVTTPPVQGMELARREIAIGGTHTGQFRLGIYAGGAAEDPDGATLLHDEGQTAGSATNAWVGIDVAPGVSVAASSLVWLAFRGNGNVTVRFGANANPEVASPDDDPRGAIALCVDGKYSHSTHRRGACSSHGGVAQWNP